MDLIFKDLIQVFIKLNDFDAFLDNDNFIVLIFIAH